MPTFTGITDGQVLDAGTLDEIVPEPGAFYVMDLDYIDFERLYALSLSAAREEQREIWNIFVEGYHAGAKSLRDGATIDEVFGAWSAELLRHRAIAKNALARQAIAVWSKREKVAFWQIHTMNLVVGNVTVRCAREPPSLFSRSLR